MSQVHALPIGDIIDDRYIIEDILGQGGFSAVYLVKDQGANGDVVPGGDNMQGETQGNLFALKELIDQDKQERIRFTFEAEILKRLSHEALPTVHRVFVDDKRNRACILMDYIEGPNLEVLRKQQPGKRFSLPQVLTIIAPIVDAVAYLHAQEPPIIHRDIKPSNIIVPKINATASLTQSQKTVLVDFGIAKEYVLDSTTTAVRHCSPGYGAPEQYSSIGTDLRTDIYGLGATCYALLSGNAPIDALQRVTKLASKTIDPLVPVNELTLGVPLGVAQVIHCAMSIGSDNRFSSVEEFWQILNEYATDNQGQGNASRDKPYISESSPSDNSNGNVGAGSLRGFQGLVPTRAISTPNFSITNTSTPLSPEEQKPSRRASRSKKMGVLALIVLALLIVVGTGFGLGSYALKSHNGSTVSVPATTSEAPSAIYPNVVRPYRGTIHDLLTNVTTPMSITRIQQNNEMFKGSFTGLHTTGSFTGVLDASKHILFTVTRGSGQNPLFFDGSVKSGGELAGNYCSLDQAGQCVGDYGIWSLVPIG